VSLIESQISFQVDQTARLRKGFRGRWLLALIVVLFGAVSAYAVVWYHRFYHHVTPQELSHEVRHSAFQASIRHGSLVTLQLYQQSNAREQQLVFFSSGDGGWSPFCADIAAHIAATGKTVVGFNSKDYLISFASSQRPISPNELTRDYEDMIKVAGMQPGIDGGGPRGSLRVVVRGRLQRARRD